MLKTGLSYKSELIVSDDNTAMAMGSGDLPVLATPAMIALMENAAMKAVANVLPEGSTTVGGKIEASHLAPSSLGKKVYATATLEKMDGRKLYFHVEAFESENQIQIGEGSHLRFIVDRERFISKL